MFRRIILPPSSVPNTWTTRCWKRRNCDPTKVSNYLPLDRTYPCRRRHYSTSGYLISFFVVATKGFLLNLSRAAWFPSLLCGVCIKYGISRFFSFPQSESSHSFPKTLSVLMCGQLLLHECCSDKYIARFPALCFQLFCQLVSL